MDKTEFWSFVLVFGLVGYLLIGLMLMVKSKGEVVSEVRYSDSCRVMFLGNLDNKHLVRMDDTIWTLVPFALGR
jgi:hypothetical protein